MERHSKMLGKNVRIQFEFVVGTKKSPQLKTIFVTQLENLKFDLGKYSRSKALDLYLGNFRIKFSRTLVKGAGEILPQSIGLTFSFAKLTPIDFAKISPLVFSL